MSGRRARQPKGAASSAPSTTSSAPQQPEDEAGGVGLSGSSHSPRMGRKEAEHKRRVVENQYYDELTTLLSMISERTVLKKMDKVTTLKEAVICIKVYYDLAQQQATTFTAASATMEKSPTTKSPSSLSSSSPCPPGVGGGGGEVSQGFLETGEMLNFFLDAHDSFLMIISDSGRILFASELVTSLLGQMRTRLVGQNVFDYVHPRHKSTIQDLFVIPEGVRGKRVPNSPLFGFPSRPFTAHFKLYSSETDCKSQYLPFICLSFLRHWVSEAVLESSSPSHEEVEPKKACTVVIGKLPTSMALVDLAISTNDVNFEFDMRISQNGRIIDIDKHAVMVFGFSTSELIGTLFFEYVDPYHISQVGESMSKFLSEGLGSTKPYRIRTKGGRCIWLISKGYLSYDPWNNKLNHILLANRVLGCDQVLPEHRFFESVKHLPDQEGKEAYYTPDLDTPAKPPPRLEPVLPTLRRNPFIRPLTSSAMDRPFFPDLSQSATPSRTSSLIAERGSGGLDNFAHLSTGTSVLEGTLDMAYQILSEGSVRGPAAPQPIIAQPRVGESTTPAPASVTGSGMLGGGSGGVAGGGSAGMAGGGAVGPQGDLQRELERKSLELLEMQRKLMEQEERFNKDRMQFFRAAQKMMQQFSSGVGGGVGTEASALAMTSALSSPPSAMAFNMEPNAILEGMSKPPPPQQTTAIDSSAPSPMSVLSPRSMIGRGGEQNVGGGGTNTNWGAASVSSPGSLSSAQHQQPQRNMQQHQGNMQQHLHGNVAQQQHSNMRQVGTHPLYISTPVSASPSFVDINQQHHTPQQQNFAPQNYPRPPSFTESNSLYGHASLDTNSLYRTSSQGDTPFHMTGTHNSSMQNHRSASQGDISFQSSLMNCLPYDRNRQHQSLEEHNMQFLQQPQQQHRPSTLYGAAGSRLLMGGLANTAATNGGGGEATNAVKGGGEGGGGVMQRGEQRDMMTTDDIDLTDILNSTSSFPHT